METLIKVFTPSGFVMVKPENLITYEEKLAKCAKYKDPKPKTEKRIFPNDSYAMHSNSIYVSRYLQINNLKFIGGLNGYVLNYNETIWPEGEEVIYSEVDECTLSPS